MTTSSFKESAAYSGIKILEVLCLCLPYAAALALGRFSGGVYYHLAPRKRRRVYRHLKIAFAQSQSPAQIRRIARRVFRTYGEKFTELIRAAALNGARRRLLVAVDGREHLDRAMAQGKGAIVLGMHFGSWELGNFIFSTFGYEYKTFANEPGRYSKLDDLLNDYRRRLGGGLLSPTSGIREFLRSLSHNAMVAVLSDQGGSDGIQIPFFGRLASMPTGAVRVGLKHDIPVLFCAIVPDGKHKHRVIFHEPMRWIHTGDAKADAKANLRQAVALMEKYIREHPHEYLWFYKVWKHSSQVKVALLTDGKAGHFNQTRRIAQIVRDIYQKRGKTVDVETVAVVYKNARAQKLLTLLSGLMPPGAIQGRLHWMRLFVTEETYRSLSRVSCDVVVSTGSATAVANHWLARENDARAVSVLKPSGLPYRWFDAVILPRHDMCREPKRPVIATEAALNLIDEKFLDEQKQKLLNRFSHLKNTMRPKIGILIGGSGKDVYLTLQQVKILIHQLKGVAQEMGAELLVTTSRRTSAAIEKFLSKELKTDDICPLFLSGRQDVPEAIGGILALSDLLVVSGDSISMVSEAAATGKRTVAFYPGIRALALKSSNKHKRFLDRMHSQGLVAACDVKNIGETVLSVSKRKIVVRKNEDNVVIKQALERIL